MCRFDSLRLRAYSKVERHPVGNIELNATKFASVFRLTSGSCPLVDGCRLEVR